MRIIAKTLYGLEQVLADELSFLGCSDIVIANRAVIFTGDLEVLYRVNYMSRTALSFLVTVKEFRINSPEDLYERSMKIKWDEFTDADRTFAVTAVVNSGIFKHSGFAALKLKDAVADYFRKKSGRRPDVDSKDPDILINLHISNDRVTISLDSSGDTLFKRGYRLEQGVAPLNEVLAAGMIKISDWDATINMLDPMCGSGTIPIEAAMIATNTPPGIFRKSFGFQKWNSYNGDLYNKIAKDGKAGIKEIKIRISASDISELAVNQASENITNAGMGNSIQLDVADFSKLKSDNGSGFLLINPPYGERMETDEEFALYSMIGTTLKHNFQGHIAWIISSNRDALKNVGLKPAKKHLLYNGALECLFLKYDLYQGSHKKREAIKSPQQAILPNKFLS